LFSFDNDSCEFYASFIAQRLTLKGLETDTLYLVFKHRVQNCIWIALQTIQTRPKQTGILTNALNSVKRPCQILRFIPKTKKRRNLLVIFSRKATLRCAKNFPVPNPLMPLSRSRGMGIIRRKTNLSIPRGTHNHFNLLA